MTTPTPMVMRPPSTIDPIYPLAVLDGAVPEAPAWFSNALRVQPERATFDVDGLAIELLTWGEVGKPGLLFLHGYAGHADWWSFVAPFFAADFRCASISLSGMGRSDRRPGSEYSIGTWAQEVAAAVKAGNLDASGKRPICIAQSMAGLVAVKAALAHDPFSALVTIDTGFQIGPTPPDQQGRLKQGHRNRLFAIVGEALARYRLSPDQDCANLYVLDYLARLSLQASDGGWRWYLDPQMTTDVNLFWCREDLRNLPCPMSYIHGERSSLVAHMIHELAEAFAPGTKVIGIPDADHNVLADQPIALITALRAVVAGWGADGTA